MMNRPTVSIILPTYNREHLIGAAIRRVLEQTYTNFELIVANDGSTDDTRGAIERVKRETNDDRIVYLGLSHMGGAQTRNEAIKQARGEFIASQDDDDEWEPDYLKEQVAKLSSVGLDYGMSYVDYRRVAENGKTVHMPPKGSVPKEGHIYGGGIMRKNYGPFQTLLIRKSVIDDVGDVCEKIESLYDWEMWLRISKKYKVAHVNKELFTYLYSADSNSRDPKKIWRRIDARLYILKKYGDDIRKFGFFGDHMSRLANLLMEAGEPSVARSKLWNGIRDNPTRVTLWGKLFASLFGARFYFWLKK